MVEGLGTDVFPQSPASAPISSRVTVTPRSPCSAAQDAHQIPGDLDLEHILDLVVAIAKIPGTPEYRQPILDAALAGLDQRGT